MECLSGPDALREALSALSQRNNINIYAGYLDEILFPNKILLEIVKLQIHSHFLNVQLNHLPGITEVALALQQTCRPPDGKNILQEPKNVFPHWRHLQW